MEVHNDEGGLGERRSRGRECREGWNERSEILRTSVWMVALKLSRLLNTMTYDS